MAITFLTTLVFYDVHPNGRYFVNHPHISSCIFCYSNDGEIYLILKTPVRGIIITEALQERGLKLFQYLNLGDIMVCALV